MAFDNFVDVMRINVAVPDAFWVDHRNRAARAAVQATRFVDANFALAGQPCFFNGLFAMREGIIGVVMCAGIFTFTFIAIVQTKEDVTFVVLFLQWFLCSHEADFNLGLTQQSDCFGYYAAMSRCR